MNSTAHAIDSTDQLQQIRERLEELVTIRTNAGFTDDERAEYARLVEAESRLL
jgi:hypothetical protein